MGKLRDTYHHYRHLLFWQIGHFRSLLEREDTIKRYIKNHKVRKLQLGSGPFPLDGWLNTELFGSPTLLPLDLSRPFPLPNNSFDYVFSEHTHEHFNLEQGNAMLREIHRVLRKRGKVRFSTPDLRFLFDLYKEKKSPIQKKYIAWSSNLFLKHIGAVSDTYVINNFVRSWGHQFIYDFKTLKQQLEKAGFSNITRYKPGISKDVHLRGIEHHGESTGESFNQLESLVVEATKR